MRLLPGILCQSHIVLRAKQQRKICKTYQIKKEIITVERCVGNRNMSLKQIYEERRMQNEPEDISDSQLIKEQMNLIGELQEQIAKLSSEKCILLDEIQKKSQKIISLNEQIGRLAESDLVLLQNEQLRNQNARLEKAVQEAEAITKDLKAETDIEPEYIKRMVDRATVQKIVGHLIYGTEIDVEEDDYGKRTEDAYARLEQITNGDEKLLASLMEVIANFSDIYAELGFRAGVIFMADIYAGRDKFGKRKGAN